MKGSEIIAFLSGVPEIVGDIVSSVVGAVFTAVFLRNNTKTEEFEKIKAAKFKEVADDLLDAGKMTYTEYYKASNFLEIAKKADRYYQEHPRKNKKETYDFDWFVRFFEAVGNVSDDTMQELWAKILAGEIAQPSSFSFKTIDVLRNMSRRDAELFVKICSHSFVIDGTRHFLPNEDEFLKSVDIQFRDIMKLSELGLIFNDGTLSLSLEISDEPCTLISNSNLLMLISSTSGKSETATIGDYPFTEAGNEISRLIGENAFNEDFLKYGEILSRDRRYKIAVHRITGKNGNEIWYDKIDLMQQDVLKPDEG